MTIAGEPPTTTSPARLTRREEQILRLLAEGYSYEQSGWQLGISLGSVRTYVIRLYRKLGVHTKSEATCVAMRSGVLR
jgi:DNA-binding CsgD family transcriptional regulator